MDIYIILHIGLLLILLVFSSFFSGSETAFFALNHLEKDKLIRNSKGKRKTFITGILISPVDILITVLTGNMIVNLFFASMMDILVLQFLQENSWLYSILISTVLLLIFGEMSPKSLAIRHALSFFSITSRFLFYVHLFLTPIRRILRAIEKRIMSLMMGGVEEEEKDGRGLISSTLQVGLQKGIVHPAELSILETFLELREKTADEVMIPRTALEGIEVSTSVDDVVQRLSGTDRRAPIPVYKEDLDHIWGYINLRDLLPGSYGDGQRIGLNKMLTPVYPVPEKKNLFELLREMMSTKREMALVIDEYGGTAGIVTFQDLIEDFLTFFYPPGEDEGIITVEEGVYLVPGFLDLDEVQELLDIELVSESRTVSGWFMEKLESIPNRGTTIHLGGYDFIVRRMAKNAIVELEVRKGK